MSKEKDGNWFKRHKILSVLLALFVIVAIGGASGGNKDTNGGSSGSKASTTASKQYRFADRADKQSKDVEVLPNETATVDGMKLTVTNVQYNTSLGAYETADSGKTYLVADVQLENASDR